MYVKGGCCRKCGSKKYLFQCCPERQKKKDEVSDEDYVGDIQEFLKEDPEENNDEAGANEKTGYKEKEGNRQLLETRAT